MFCDSCEKEKENKYKCPECERYFCAPCSVECGYVCPLCDPPIMVEINPKPTRPMSESDRRYVEALKRVYLPVMKELFMR